jgi:hypothetical protein
VAAYDTDVRLGVVRHRDIFQSGRHLIRPNSLQRRLEPAAGTRNSAGAKDRKFDDHPRAAARHRGDVNRSAMGFDKTANDGEAEPGAAGGAIARMNFAPRKAG